MKEMQQYLGVLRQLRDFDENLSREIAAKAYQEQERIKLEVKKNFVTCNRGKIEKTVVCSYNSSYSKTTPDFISFVLYFQKFSGP